MGRARAVGEQVHLLFLDSVLHLPARTIVLLVDRSRTELAAQRRHHKPRIGALGQVLGLGHHPPRPRPTLARLIGKLFAHPRGFARLFVPLPRLLHLRLDLLDQPAVLGHCENVVNVRLPFAPRHQLFAAKSAVAPNPNLYLRPPRVAAA